MVTRALPVDITNLLIDGALYGAGGGIQRMAWERSERMMGVSTGALVTGALILGGLGMATFARGGGDMGRRIASAAFGSGMTVAGWLFAEKALVLGNVGAGSQSLPGGMEAMSLPSYQFAGVPRAQAQAIDMNGIQKYQF